MRENDPGKTGIPEQPPVPPSAGDDRELDEILELLGNDALSPDPESAALSDSDSLIDDIPKEYDAADPSDAAVSEMAAAKTPAVETKADEPTQRIEKPAVPPPAPSAPAAHPASPSPEPAAAEEEEPDVRRTISDQVSQVMDQKKAQSRRVPKRVAGSGTVQVAAEYENAPADPGSEPASSAPPVI